MIDSSSRYYVNKLEALHTKALCIIDCNIHRSDNIDVLENIYSLDTPQRRRNEHHCMIMFRLSKLGRHIDGYRPLSDLGVGERLSLRNIKET